MIATNLRCEYELTPLSVVEPNPRLSWTASTTNRGQAQSAYQILVASSRDRLSESEADLWNSGKVSSSACAHMAYSGKELLARQQCWWTVRLWGSDREETEWSEPARWEMGLFGEQDWLDSVWIGRDCEPGDANPAPYLRKEFSAQSAVTRATVYACGLGYAELYVNGTKVGEDTERNPGYTNFEKRVLYVAHDVTSLLTPGTNIVGAIVGTGWYDVHDITVWGFENAPWRGRPRLRLALFVECADGGLETVLSDDSWRMSTGPILRDGIYTGEIYDARLEMPGWSTADFDNSSWSAPDIMPPPAGKLSPRICSPVAITKEFEPISIAEPAPGVFVADMGQNFSGHARLKLNAPSGTGATMRYAEKLDASGMIDQSNLNHFMMDKEQAPLFQSDQYVCRGGGEEVWEQCFAYAGFRYVEVTGLTSLSKSEITGCFAHTRFENAGEFSCSDEMLNKIQQATRWAYLSNAQNIPTDCPQREKNGWTGDVHMASETGLMNFKTASFYTKWLNDLQDSQMPDGRLPLIVPTPGWGLGDCHPAWDSVYAILMWDLYRYCADVRILERHFSHLSRYVDYLCTRTTDGIVAFDSLGDWIPWQTETPSTLTSTAFFYHDARILAAAARVLGLSADAEKYEQVAASTRATYNSKFLNADHFGYANESQTANAISLYFGLAPDEQRGKILNKLIDRVEASPKIDTGILGAKYLIRVLSEAGRADLAYTLITQPEQPSWAWWINQGATTLWEDWKGEASLNHIMFGDVSNWMYQWIAGIGLDESTPGFQHIKIQPQLVGGLTWASAEHDSIHGRIKLSWRLEEGEFRLDVTIPCSCTATVYLPATNQEAVYVDGQKLAQVEYVEQLDLENGCVILSIGSGEYEFVVNSELP